MKVIENDTILFECVEPKLAAHDDRELWRTALSAPADEFAQRYGH
jgi:hypothetical protein